MSLLVWTNAYQEGFCALGALEGVDADEEILRGSSRAADFPSGAFYQMRDEYADTRVADSAYAAIHYVVSERLRQVLEPELGKSRVELLPVRIKDQRGTVVDGSWFVMNPLDVVDCIDTQASNAKFNANDPTQILRVKKLVLKPAPDELALFRPAHWTRLMFIRDDLAQKLEAAGLTGLHFWETDEFKG